MSSDLLSNFVVFEGCDGSGTTTQLKILEDRFAKSAGALPPFMAAFEPTNGPIGLFIRKVLSGDVRLENETLARLFAADRNEHLYGKGGIVQAAERGTLVVCDRYVLSSLVYQGLECGDDLPRRLNVSFPAPETLIFFDIDSETALKRMESRNAKDIYERLDFQMQVRSRYKSLLDLCRSDGTAVHLIDSSKSIEAVAAEVWSIIQKLPIVP